MAIIEGLPAGVPVAGSGGFDIMKAIQGGKEVISGIKELIILSKGGSVSSNNVPQIAASTVHKGDFQPIYQPQPAQPCKIEAIVKSIYDQLNTICNAGQGDLKILELLQLKNPSIKDARDLLGKVLQ